MDEKTASLVQGQANDLIDKKGDLYSLLTMFFENASRTSFDCVFPVEIGSIDRNTRLITVKPLLRSLNKATGQQERQDIVCTAFQYAANGFVIDFPLKVGDKGWCIAGDRMATEVKFTHKLQNLTSLQAHKFEFGFFIPDYYGVLMDKERKNELNPYQNEENRLVISTFDGTQKVSIGQCDIKVYSTNTTINTTSDCTINAGAGVNVNASADINLTVPKGVVKVDAKTVQAKADSITFDTKVLDVTGGGGFQGAASGTITAGSMAQVKDGIIVSIGTA